MENKHTDKKVISVIGGGSWATAIIKILSEQEHVAIHWWLRNEKDVAHILKFGHNPSYASDIAINLQKVFPSSDILKATQASDIIILAVPSAFIKSIIDQFDLSVSEKIVVSAVKGMIPDENLLISEYINRRFSVKEESLCAIGGPCHSEEVALEKQSYLSIAAKSPEVGKLVAGLFSCRFVKATVVEDLYGVEYSAIMKNIIAIACGVARGLNYGDNFQAVLVSNSMKEVEQFLDTLCPQQRNLYASAYLGDLLVTSYSQFSRNRTLGNMIGRGYSLKTAMIEMKMIAEGFFGVKSIHEISKDNALDLPVVNAVYNILYEKICPSVEFKKLEKLMR
ncbi:NAD(P)-binding domain-containing protein [Cytophagaceae bacterium ABcell3]|nr:NAD(P)-binding domain-containing protein [Cytophagaceae bacterium ABcell3]